MDWNGWYAGWGAWLLWSLLVVLLLGVFLALGQTRRKNRRNSISRTGLRPSSSELTIELERLDDRYARGEISQADYERRKNELITKRRNVA